MSMKASARLVGPTLRSEIDVNGRHTIVTDEPARLGGTNTGPAPHELLPAAVAACVSTTIAMYARTKGWDLAEIVVDVDYDNEATPRRLDVEVHLPDSLAPAQVDRLRRVAATCPIRRSLEAGFAIEERFDFAPRHAPDQAA
jgi:putative redox protein